MQVKEKKLKTNDSRNNSMIVTVKKSAITVTYLTQWFRTETLIIRSEKRIMGDDTVVKLAN